MTIRKQEIAALRQRIADLEARLAALEARMASMEAQGINPILKASPLAPSVAPNQPSHWPTTICSQPLHVAEMTIIKS